MNLIDVFTRYPDQERCIEHLEAIRWPGDEATCPYCNSANVARKVDGRRVGRWNCHNCHSSFNVLSGTIFEKTKVPLQKWFLAIALMVNAKKSLSSRQLGRDLELTHQTALYMQHRIRSQMAAEQRDLLHGIIEIDESYVGGKPRRHWDGSPPSAKRGRVAGAVERGGPVVAQAADDVTGKRKRQFVQRTVDTEASVLITDEYTAYNTIGTPIPHAVIAKACWKYNRRKETNECSGFTRSCFA